MPILFFFFLAHIITLWRHALANQSDNLKTDCNMVPRLQLSIYLQGTKSMAFNINTLAFSLCSFLCRLGPDKSVTLTQYREMEDIMQSTMHTLQTFQEPIKFYQTENK